MAPRSHSYVPCTAAAGSALQSSGPAGQAGALFPLAESAAASAAFASSAATVAAAAVASSPPSVVAAAPASAAVLVAADSEPALVRGTSSSADGIAPYSVAAVEQMP